MRRLERDTIARIAEKTTMSRFLCHICGCAFELPEQLVLNVVVCPDCKESTSNEEIHNSPMTMEEWALEIARVRAEVAKTFLVPKGRLARRE